jgi:superfamily II DNA or RNA helicase
MTREEIQKEALNKVTSIRRCTAALSMGVGKTLIGLQYIDEYQSTSLLDLRVLVVAPKLSIFTSWTDDAEKFNLKHLLSNITFTTYVSLPKMDPKNYDLLVLDECHSLLFRHQKFLSEYKGPILGLTGTPPRYGKSEKGQMVAAYCPVVYTYVTDTAVDDGILNDYRIHVHNLSLDSANNFPVKLKNQTFMSSEVKSYEYWTKRLNEAPNKKMEQISAVMRMRTMMDFKSKEKYAKYLLDKTKDKCIIFCNTQDQADRLCDHSYHSNNEWSDLHLTAFKKGTITKLSCVSQLNEGVTVPDLRAGIILHAYGNERKSNQRIGRLLRLNPDDVATIHILCYKHTIDEKWVAEALKDLDPEKISYYNVQKS